MDLGSKRSFTPTRTCSLDEWDIRRGIGDTGVEELKGVEVTVVAVVVVIVYGDANGKKRQGR